MEGIGHFEPLRHYAEVHLLLEPGERGSGLQFGSACPEDMLDRNWQRLVLTHLAEREHLGVLTGSPITDMSITLVAGPGPREAHRGRRLPPGHLSGGAPGADAGGEHPAGALVRLPPGAARRAGGPGPVRPPAHGRARRHRRRRQGEETVLTGGAPVAGLRDYAREVAAYTRGRGRLFCTLRGYAPCRTRRRWWRPWATTRERDTDNPADSVFCAHGAGVTVKWDQVPAQMHVDSGLRLEEPEEEEPPPGLPPGGAAAMPGPWSRTRSSRPSSSGPTAR